MPALSSNPCDKIRERDHFPTARGPGAALNRQSTALAVPTGRQFSHSIVAFRAGRIPWPPRQSTRFTSRGSRRTLASPTHRSRRWPSRSSFWLAPVRPKYLTADVAAGVPLPTVAAVLGHANLTLTAINTTAISTEAREPLTRAHLRRVRTEVVTGRSIFPSTYWCKRFFCTGQLGFIVPMDRP